MKIKGIFGQMKRSFVVVQCHYYHECLNLDTDRGVENKKREKIFHQINSYIIKFIINHIFEIQILNATRITL